jgi:PAS domain S-box-containing protein
MLLKNQAGSAICEVQGLCRNEAFLKLAGLTRDLMAIVCDDRIAFVNEAGAAMLGLPKPAVIGRHFLDFVHPDYTGALGADLSATQEEGVLPTKLRRADGKSLDVELTASRHGCGRTTAVMLLARDIGVMRERAMRSRWREQQLSGILETVADGIITINERGTIQSYNAAAQVIFGWSPAEVIGRNVSMLMPDPDRSRHDGYLGAYLISGRPRIIGKSREVIGLRRDETTFPMDLTVTELRSDGQCLFIGVIRDLTERKRAERERETLRNQLYHSQKMEAIAQLASGIAHDFNNIVNAMVACADNALSAVDPVSPAAKDIEQVISAGWRAGDIVNQLLTFSKQHAGESRLVALDAIVTEVAALVKAALPRAIALQVEIGHGPFMVLGDPTRLFQVLTNLCVNARQAMGRGPGTLTITLDKLAVRGIFVNELERYEGEGCPRKISTNADETAKMWIGQLMPGPHARLTIADTGCGMDAATLERIFEPFFTTKPDGEGTGLGLAAVHGIVTGIGGGVVVETAPSAGAAFTVLLPLLQD